MWGVKSFLMGGAPLAALGMTGERERGLPYIKDSLCLCGSGVKLSSADEVHDFEFVGVVEDRIRPAVAGDDVVVEFHGHAVGLEGELVEERGQGEAGVELALLAINDELHRAYSKRYGGGRERAESQFGARNG